MTHPDTDTLAEFHAGLITGRHRARIADHLASCERCTALGAQLAEVSVLLAAVPAPAMPQRLAHRLDTVLAAEIAEKNNFSERARGDSSPEPRSPQRRSGNRGLRLVTLRVLAPAAAVVLAAAGYGLSLLGGGAPKHTASAASGRHAQAPIRQGAVPGAEQPGAKPAFMSPHSFMVHISTTNYRHGTLRQQLVAELRAPAEARSTRTPSGQVMACVRLVTNDTRPVYVESARFNGQPATVIVASQRSGDEDAWVTGARCSATDKDLLDSTTLPPGI